MTYIVKYIVKFFLGTIKDEIVNIINVKDESSLDDFTEDITHLKETANNWKEWLQVIENKLEKKSRNETNRPNAYRNIQFAKILKKDILLLPL